MNETKPQALPVIPDNIPAELRERRQWAVWRYVQRDRGRAKKPYNPRTGESAKANKPETWVTFDEAVAAYESGKWEGIGYIFSANDPYVGIDLDKCVSEGVVAPWTPQQREAWENANAPNPADIIRLVGSYSEVSASGKGVKIIARGSIPVPPKRTGKRAGCFEIYRERRFFALTGQTVPNSPAECRECADLGKLCELFEKRKKQKDAPAPESTPTPAESTPVASTSANFAEQAPRILSVAFGGANAGKLLELWNGGQGGYQSHSEADSAQAQIWAFYCGNNPELIEYLMRRGEGREKWNNRPEWLRDTIQKAIEVQGRIGFYKWEGEQTTDAPRLLTLAQLHARSAAGYEYMVDGLLVRHESCVVAGKDKCLKTSILCDLGVSLATGTAFLGQFAVPKEYRVAFYSSESGEVTLDHTVRAVLGSKGLEKDCPPDNLLISTDIPNLESVESLARLEAEIRGEGIEVVILDPLCDALPSLSSNDANANRRPLNRLRDMCKKWGCTPIIAHHNRKTSIGVGDVPTRDDLYGPGVGSWMRQWWLLNRKTEFDPLTRIHELLMVVGASAGHAENVGVEVYFPACELEQWEPSVVPFVPGKGKKAQAGDSVEKKREQIREFLTGKPPQTKSAIREAVGLSGANVGSVLGLMQDVESVKKTSRGGNEQVRYVLRSIA